MPQVPVGAAAWKYKAIAALTGGIDANTRPDLLDDSQCITLNNVVIREGIVAVDTGYKPFGSTLQGIPQQEIKFQRANGAIETLLVTTTTVYKWASNVKQWQLVKGTTTAVGLNGNFAGDFVLNVVSSAGFAVGDLVGVNCADGYQHIGHITDIFATQIWVEEPLPAGKVVNAGASFYKFIKLNGIADLQVSWCVVASNDWLVFTNGVDNVKYYDGTSIADVPNLPSGGSTTCVAVAVYNAALFLFNTTEGGARFPVRCRRSDQGDPSNWTTGTAGKDDLYDLPGPILDARILGPYLIVYRTDSVARGQFIGVGGQNYQFDTMATSDGICATNCVIDFGTYHLMMGGKNIYKYSGGYDLVAIGRPIFNLVFGKFGNIAPNKKLRSFGFLVDELNEAWFAYCSTSAVNSPDTVLRFDLDNGVWYTRKFADEMAGAGSFQNVAVFTWDDLVGSWNDQTWKWNAQVAVSANNTVHLLDTTNSRVVTYDYLASLDDDAPIQYTIETKDFIEPGFVCRFDMLEVFGRAGDCTISYLTDNREGWKTFEFDSTMNNNSVTKKQFFQQFKFHHIRFRFSGTGHLKFFWFAFYYKIESTYDADFVDTTTP